MEGFFERMTILKEKYKAVDTLGGYEAILTKDEIERAKKDIEKQVLDIVEKQFYKFNK